MKKILETIKSNYDNLNLAVLIIAPEKNIKGIVQFSHGMAEHKERYEPFMQFLAEHGYACIIHDHRGHGASVKVAEDLGYLYSDDAEALVDDLYQVTQYAKEQFPGVPVMMFAHSMGTLIARCYLKKYDDTLDKLILCGTPTKNLAVGAGLFISRLWILLKGEKYRSRLIDHFVTGPFRKTCDKQHPNAWISIDEQTIKDYDEDTLCGYCFTNNAFYNLFQLQKNAYRKKGWQLKNPKLAIHLIAGEFDPVIRSKEHFARLQQFLTDRGYVNVTSRLYPGQKHELLNSRYSEEIPKDILRFYDSNN